MILRHLRDYGSVTNYELVLEYGIGSSTRRITDLRQRGYPIKSVPMHGVNRYGEKTSYTRYELDKSAAETQLRMKL
jgi:hypothetical protein